MDLTPKQISAIYYGGDMGGEYIEEIQKTNLTELTKDEWYQFIRCIVVGYMNKMGYYDDCDDVPF